jgi:hypothetical protein
MSQFYGNPKPNFNNNNNFGFNSAVHDVLARYFSQQVSPQQAQALVSRLPQQWPDGWQIEQTLQNAGMTPSQLRSQLVNALNSIHPQNQNFNSNQPQQQPFNNNPNYNSGYNNNPSYNNPGFNPNYNNAGYNNSGYNPNYYNNPNYNNPSFNNPGYNPNYYNNRGYNPGFNNYNSGFINPSFGGGYNHFWGYGSPQVLGMAQWMMLDSMFMQAPGFQPGLGFIEGELLFDQAMMGGWGGYNNGMNPMQMMTEVTYDAEIAYDLSRGDIGDAVVDEIEKKFIEGMGF